MKPIIVATSLILLIGIILGALNSSIPGFVVISNAIIDQSHDVSISELLSEPNASLATSHPTVRGRHLLTEGSIYVTSTENTTNATRTDKLPAEWMSGKWGIGWRIRAGDIGIVYRYKPHRIVREIEKIPGVSYVLFNLSQGASGDRYLAPHSVLSKINPGACPKRDLFGELAAAFQRAGYKVVAYMATEGPAKLKHGKRHAFDWNGLTSPSVDSWSAWVKDHYNSSDPSTLKQAYAEVIVGEYAERYGTQIDGWWFDHASFGDMSAIHDVVKRANGDAILAFSHGKRIPLRNNNPLYEDFTSGHPASIRRAPANSQVNLPMVQSVEASENGYLYAKGQASLGHMFMPMHERWNSGKRVVWSEEQAVDWMERVLNAGGSWTWNVPTNDRRSRLHGLSGRFARRVSSQLNITSNKL